MGLAETYEFDLVAWLYETMKIEGGKARILFKSVGKGLMDASKGSKTLKLSSTPSSNALPLGRTRPGWAEAVIDGDTVWSHPGRPVPLRFVTPTGQSSGSQPVQ